MSLPPELLNRINKELKVQVDRNQSELQRLQSVTRLEQEVFQVTQQKLRDAKQQFSQVQVISDTTSNKLREEEHTTALEGREIARMRQELELKQGRSRDFLRRVEVAERSIFEAKQKVSAAEESTAQNEDAISQWIAENRTTVAATSQASQVLAAGDQRIKALRREVELLKIQTKQMEEATASQDAETSEIQKEIEDAVQTRIASERETLRVRSQIADLLAREEEIRTIHAAHQRKVADLAEALEAKKREVRDVQAELASTEATVAAQQRAITSCESKKHQAAVALLRETEKADEAEADARVCQVEQTVLLGTIAKKKKELASHREVLERQKSKFAQLDARRTELQAELKQSEQEKTTADEEEQQAARLLRHFAAELQVASAAEERGRRKIQEEIALHRQDCVATDDVAQQLNVLRRALRAQTEKEQVLQDRAKQLSAVTSAIDQETEDVKLRIALEGAKQAEMGMAFRQAKRAEIDTLREELAEWERSVRHSKAAVEQVRSMLLKDKRTSEGIASVTAEMELEIKNVTFDITRLQEELQSLATVKATAASTAEGVFWQLEEMKHKAGALAQGLTSQLLDLGDLEAQGRAEEVRLEGEQEARKIELHSHEEDRRRMHRRLQAASSQLQLLQSRYADVMSAMQSRLDKEALDKDLDPIFEEKRSGGVPAGNNKGALVVTPHLEDAFADPEEIEARHVLLRALERDKLLTYGNSLDDQIVRMEKQLSALTKAVGSLRGAVQRDHDVLVDATRSLRSAGSSRADDAVESNALLLLEGIGLSGDALQELVADMQEEQSFLLTLRQAFSADVQQRAQQLEDEVVSWEANISEKSCELRLARENHARVVGTLEDAMAQRSALQETYRGLERRLNQQQAVDRRNGLSIDARHRLARTMLDKQRVVQSSSAGQERVRQQHLQEALDAALQAFQRAVVRVSANERSERCFFIFRQLCDKYGVRPQSSSSSSVVTPAQSTRCQPPPRPNTSTSSHMDKDRRPASRALVCPASRALVSAMREVRIDPVVHTGRSSSCARASATTLHSIHPNSSRPAAVRKPRSASARQARK